jgi:hypothetical protein
MSSCKAPGGGFTLTVVSTLVWGADIIYTPSKNREKIGALALGGRRSIGRYNNQTRLGVSNRKSLTEEEWLGRNVWRCVFLLFGAVIGETKIK